MKNHFLYHSFPRRFRKSNTEEKAAQILQNIIDYGLLLTPEVVTWVDPQPHKRQNPDLSYAQLRVCFTELSRSEVTDHSREFGPFSIEWPIEEARKFGAIPVFYIPTNDAAEDFSAIGVALVHRLWEIYEVLGILDEWKRDEGACDKTVNTTGGLRLGTAKQVVAQLFEGRLTPDSLQNSLKAVMNHFYPCENLRYTTTMGYYQQREWRFAGRLHSRYHKETAVEDIPDELKIRLLKLDPAFFDKTLTAEGETISFLKGCGVYKTAFGKHVLEYASRIVCPQSSVSEVKKMLLEGGLSLPVVAIEDC